MKISPYAAATVAALCVISVIMILPLYGPAGSVERTVVSMGTVVEIKARYGRQAGRDAISLAIDRAIDEIRRVERLFNAFSPESEVSRINRLRKGEPLEADPEVLDLIVRAEGFSAATDGAFDITVKPLVDLWRGAKKSGQLPADGDIRDALRKVGYRDLVVDRASGTLMFAKDGMAIDMAAIAKGYAADRAAAVLKANGAGNAIIDCGGDMYCLGGRNAGEGWKVGIRHPRNGPVIFMELKLSDRAIDTSGDYERFFVLDGRRYSHIIDPRTGYPAAGSTVSASVVAADSVTADAFATALCVMGRGGFKAIGAVQGTDAVIVSEEAGKLEAHVTDGFMERYHAVRAAAL